MAMTQKFQQKLWFILCSQDNSVKGPHQARWSQAGQPHEGHSSKRPLWAGLRSNCRCHSPSLRLLRGIRALHTSRQHTLGPPGSRCERNTLRGDFCPGRSRAVRFSDPGVENTPSPLSCSPSFSGMFCKATGDLGCSKGSTWTGSIWNPQNARQKLIRSRCRWHRQGKLSSSWWCWWRRWCWWQWWWWWHSWWRWQLTAREWGTGWRLLFSSLAKVWFVHKSQIKTKLSRLFPFSTTKPKLNLLTIPNQGQNLNTFPCSVFQACNTALHRGSSSILNSNPKGSLSFIWKSFYDHFMSCPLFPSGQLILKEDDLNSGSWRLQLTQSTTTYIGHFGAY